jgi:hypothetical protein
MKKANWLSSNVRSIIGLIVIVYILNFFSLILLFGYGSQELIDRMETSLTNVMMFVLGYYFSANHINPSARQNENKDIEINIKNEDKTNAADMH